jgi:hypothetical protein
LYFLSKTVPSLATNCGFSASAMVVPDLEAADEFVSWSNEINVPMVNCLGSPSWF